MARLNMNDYKVGPLLGWRTVDIDTNDFVSPYDDHHFFFVRVNTTSGSETLVIEDALGTTHILNLEQGRMVTFGDMPVLVRKVISVANGATEATVIDVAF